MRVKFLLISVTGEEVGVLVLALIVTDSHPCSDLKNWDVAFGLLVHN